MSEFARRVLIDKGRTLITKDHPKAELVFKVLKRCILKTNPGYSFNFNDMYMWRENDHPDSKN